MPSKVLLARIEMSKPVPTEAVLGFRVKTMPEETPCSRVERK